ncbi:LytTR family DNA-binding domain-containing protein [uncultured Shimia sp.]|uniref:LytTR family DNA-binding domain-containing protein n=1 Tax=uncultured Shimia sp. TaxID=573152 RepID=UPI00260258F9|nr:LytTR family DNA-binding domain-containing protein [uncultured Shimia sp.]
MCRRKIGHRVVDRKADIIRDSFRTLLSPICLTIWAVATIVAIVAGPFGTFTALGSGARVAYWGSISITSIALGYSCVAFVNVLWQNKPSRQRELGGTVLAVFVITADVWLISNSTLWGPGNAVGYFEMLGYVTLVTIAATLTKYLAVSALPGWASTPPQTADLGSKPRLLRRVPEAQDDVILHLSVQDHFVEITTSSGTHSLRMRFKEALEELDNVAGFRVHRSHWVAKESIAGIERDQSRHFLLLRNGMRIPVSRNYKPALEQAGIL